MGISNLKKLVDDGQPVSPEEVDAHQESLRAEAAAEPETRSDVEMDFATSRDDIDAKFADKVAKATEVRDNAHKKNVEKREKTLEKVGLNPNGSIPRDREPAAS